MPRKIANKALIQMLKDSKALLEQSVQHQRWMITKVWAAVNFGGDTARKDAEVAKSIEAIEGAVRIARDIDHAIAALEQEIDDE